MLGSVVGGGVSVTRLGGLTSFETEDSMREGGSRVSELGSGGFSGAEGARPWALPLSTNFRVIGFEAKEAGIVM